MSPDTALTVSDWTVLLSPVCSTSASRHLRFQTSPSAMAVRGQRFELDLSSDEEEHSHADGHVQPISPFNFVADVLERAPSTPAPPQPPTSKNARDGFPMHRKRVGASRFKKSRTTEKHDGVGADNPGGSGRAPGGDDFLTAERRRIDEENSHKLAEMSPEEIEQERKELLQSLDPSLIERLLRRANIGDGESQSDFPGLESQEPPASAKTDKPSKSVKFASSEDVDINESVEESPVHEESLANSDVDVESDSPGSNHNEQHEAASHLHSDGNVHFPRPTQPPSLDPSSPSFLTDLHEKYFPSLPADPEKLEWMNPSKSDDTYSPSQVGLDPRDIRFNFNGALIPPKLAAEIPVTAGLHHHGNAPDAAGYTIQELAMLARSSVPAQRCVAFQTLGRILYRLGKGEFGDPGDGGEGTVGAEDTLGALARGLWGEVEREGAIELCIAESEGEGVAGSRHVSSRAYATEAVWLWQKGGGRRMKAG
ncbi:hypothetical protein M8818_000155 [Zalaria obscura]|uniref:Uncharacterized protein n=1 Tax=Zalaria obscura TaxID=2024903 RepID=A0ACC3SNS1_9PEZI